MKSKELKKTEEIERLAEWRALSPEAQLKELDLRLGISVGAKKQRERLTVAVR